MPRAQPTADEVKKGRGLEGRWVGELMPGQSAPTTDRMSTLPAGKQPFGDERVAEARLINTARLNLEPMFRLALDSQYMEEGETRLVARCDEVLPGETIAPAASQIRGATLVVAHLDYADPPPPERDTNTRREIKATDDRPSDNPFEL